MRNYGNWNGQSGISRYDDSSPDFIIIEYNRKSNYKFSAAKIGASNLSELKKLAASGSGLAAFIKQNEASLPSEKLPDSPTY